MEVDEFELEKGLILKATYAHVMAPYLMAFNRPEKIGRPHPASWKNTNGGMGFDINIELSIAKCCNLTNFDRLNTLWWALSLLRLKTGAKINVPVVSNIAFSVIRDSNEEPNLWVIESPLRQLATKREPPEYISIEDMIWTKKVLVSGSQLMDNEIFNRAFQTFDQVIWAHSLGSAIVMLWAALETLFRPGRGQITKSLAKSIAVFLNEAGPERDRTYQKVEKLYGVRGGIVHNTMSPDSNEFFESASIARQCLIKCLELNQVPVSTDLLLCWKNEQ